MTQDEKNLWFKCRRKKTFNKVSTAEAHIKRLKKQGFMGRGLKAYKCKYCDKYHIGHLRPKDAVDKILDGKL